MDLHIMYRFSSFTSIYAAALHNSQLLLSAALGIGFTVLLWTFIRRFALPRLHTLYETKQANDQERENAGGIWRSKYPPFEGIHALFDRGDALMAAVLVATTLQLAHPKIGKVLKAHSTYETDPWRRLVRTLSFIRISIRAKSAERSQVFTWLDKIHVGINLFEFENMMFVLATIAYGLVRAHRELGCVTDNEVDILLRTIMKMANRWRTSAEDSQEPVVPTSLSDVERFLSDRVSFDPAYLEKILQGSIDLTQAKRKRVRWKISNPLLLVKYFFVDNLWKDIAYRILIPKNGKRKSFALNFAKLLHPFWSHFHNHLCPRFLKFDGTFDLLFDLDPSLRDAVDGVYEEIFGVDNALNVQKSVESRSGASLLPKIVDSKSDYDPDPRSSSSSLCHALLEHIKCAYFRQRLAASDRAGQLKLPAHLGVIMDGNRRYARHNRLGSVVEGHKMGARKLLEFTSWCLSAGITSLTVWALSDDNLKRGREELDPLFATMADYIREVMMGDASVALCEIRLRIVGDRSILPSDLNSTIDAAEKAIDAAEKATGERTHKLNLQLAVGYGGRAETTRAMKRAVRFRAQEEGMSLEEALSKLTVNDVSKHTYSAELGLPEIDAILRTSGESRLSGFALWESQSAEIVFMAENWPSLTQSAFLQSILNLSRRNRRHGA